ncbi:MAG: hypothetical protein AAB441_02245 [Patescibacteria group bacterium]
MKNFMFIIVAALLATGINWGYGKYQVLMQKDDLTKKTANEIPSSTTGDFLNK